MTETHDRFTIEIAWDRADGLRLASCEVTTGCTVAEALREASLQGSGSGLDTCAWTIGIRGKLVTPDRRLMPGDRIEIYRALQADPKQARRQRVKRDRRLSLERTS